eukprot:CAMPEP_0119362088 /NCGR_PEP_ID=MMETSP1334-20130426/9248_1 /TAXON_ID=127549 /ORGANISM="Calcidiscus leptoporus, Strain RCC1130" /LENGTH=211 /DNA_ID=CAMNT_0007377255 /DNA_START=978 /DNA_END=1610 /DNA_ORIENTATION=-
MPLSLNAKRASEYALRADFVRCVFRCSMAWMPPTVMDTRPLHIAVVSGTRRSRPGYALLAPSPATSRSLLLGHSRSVVVMVPRAAKEQRPHVLHISRPCRIGPKRTAAAFLVNAEERDESEARAGHERHVNCLPRPSMPAAASRTSQNASFRETIGGIAAAAGRMPPIGGRPPLNGDPPEGTALKPPHTPLILEPPTPTPPPIGMPPATPP